jgi:hypothetical protein
VCLAVIACLLGAARAMAPLSATEKCRWAHLPTAQPSNRCLPLPLPLPRVTQPLRRSACRAIAGELRQALEKENLSEKVRRRRRRADALPHAQSTARLQATVDLRGRIDSAGKRHGKVIDYRLSEMRAMELLEGVVSYPSRATECVHRAICHGAAACLYCACCLTCSLRYSSLTRGHSRSARP